jgi:sulfatase maturation enzyme AslB (radical SAM superfamily)
MSFQENRKQQFTFEVTTTALCNLGCTYCFEGVKTDKRRLDDKLPLVKQRIYELLDSKWFNEKYGNLNLSFWGGEPSLNGKMIIDLINEFNPHPAVEFHIYTNGYNRKRLEEIFDSVDCSKLHIQISYDGKDINDKFRLTHTGKPTSTQVVENIEYFAKKGINISLKSTIPIKSMTGLHRTWKDFYAMHEKFSEYQNSIRINYSPTIDYVNDIPSGDLPAMIADFRKEMLMIAKEEIQFFKKNGYHLMSWFDGGDVKQHCASGANMHALDVDGQGYACHGSLYSPNKESMKGSDIHDDKFVDQVAAMSESYSIPIRDVSDVCKGCVATTCMICPVTSLDKSEKTEFFDRWTDRWVNNMCGFFKSFGEIDRTVQAYLDNELQTVKQSVEEKVKQEEI